MQKFPLCQCLWRHLGLDLLPKVRETPLILSAGGVLFNIDGVVSPPSPLPQQVSYFRQRAQVCLSQNVRILRRADVGLAVPFLKTSIWLPPVITMDISFCLPFYHSPSSFCPLSRPSEIVPRRERCPFFLCFQLHPFASGAYMLTSVKSLGTPPLFDSEPSRDRGSFLPFSSYVWWVSGGCGCALRQNMPTPRIKLSGALIEYNLSFLRPFAPEELEVGVDPG